MPRLGDVIIWRSTLQRVGKPLLFPAVPFQAIVKMGITEQLISRSRSGVLSVANGTVKTVPMGGSVNVTNADELLELLASGEIKEVDCCFADPLGQWQHCSFHPSMVRSPFRRSCKLLLFQGNQATQTTSVAPGLRSLRCGSLQVTRETLLHGFPFDGSSIRLLTSIEKSDMFMKPGKKVNPGALRQLSRCCIRV